MPEPYSSTRGRSGTYTSYISIRRRINQITQKSGATIVFGFVDFQQLVSKTGIAQSSSLEPYNSVGIVSPSGKLISQYDKIHLVPFGEYIPLEEIFFFIDKISKGSNFLFGWSQKNNWTSISIRKNIYFRFLMVSDRFGASVTPRELESSPVQKKPTTLGH